MFGRNKERERDQRGRPLGTERNRRWDWQKTTLEQKMIPKRNYKKIKNGCFTKIGKTLANTKNR